MKRLSFKWILPVVAMPMLMASCNSDEPRPEIQQYVTIDRVGVGELQTRGEIEATGNFMKSGSRIQLWFDSGKDDARYNASKMIWQCDGQKWSSTTPLLWGGGSAKYIALCCDREFYAHESRFGFQYFYNDNRFTLNESLLGSSYGKAGWYDLLVAQGTATDASLDLKFTHALAKVIINTNILSSKAGSNVSSKFYNLYVTADCSVSVTDGLKYNFDNRVTGSQYLAGDKTGEYYSCETLVIPQSVDDLMLKIYISEKEEYIVKFDNTQTFEAGKIYEYDVVAGDSNAELKNVTVSQWDDIENAANLVTQ